VTYAYDLANRLTGVSDNSAAIVKPSTSANYSVAYAYDAMNRPVSATWPNVAAQTTPPGTTVSSSFTYDATNRVMTITLPDPKILSLESSSPAPNYYLAADGVINKITTEDHRHARAGALQPECDRGKFCNEPAGDLPACENSHRVWAGDCHPKRS